MGLNPRNLEIPKLTETVNSLFVSCYNGSILLGFFFEEVFPQNALKAEPLNMGRQPVIVSSLFPITVKSSGLADKDLALGDFPKGANV